MKFKALAFIPLLVCLSVQSQLLPDTSTIHDIQKNHIDANVPTAQKHELFIVDEIKRYFKLSKTDSVEIHSELLRDKRTQSGISYPKFYRWVMVTKNKWPIISGAIRYALIEKKRAEITDFVDAHWILEDPSMSLNVFPSEVHKVAVVKAQTMKQVQDKCSEGKKFEQTSKYQLENGYLFGSNKGEWIGELKFLSKSGDKYQILKKNIISIINIKNRIFILTGLGHLALDYGDINELKLVDGRWVVYSTVKLPGEPIALTNIDDKSIKISTRKGIVIFSSDQPLKYVDCGF